MGFPIDNDFSLFDVESEHEDAKLHPRLAAYAFMAGKSCTDILQFCYAYSHYTRVRRM